MQSPAPDWESLGVAGALLVRYQQDQQALVEELATFLESTLPRQTSIRRTLGGIGRRRATGLSVEIGGTRYEHTQGNRSGLEAGRTRVVRGVAVRTEPMEVKAWLEELSAALANELERIGGGRAALERLLHS